MSQNPPFEFGQQVYVVHSSAHAQRQVTCPVCDGQRRITVILGDGERVSVECRFCEEGYLGSQGTVNAYGPSASVTCGTVDGISLDHRGEWDIQVRGICYRVGSLFTTEAEAEAAREIAYAEAEKYALESYEEQFKRGRKSKGYGWTVGYHRDQIKYLERKLAWHRNKVRAVAEDDGR